MPVKRRHDFEIAGKGFMLQRGQFSGRAWTRAGQSDAPGQRSSTDARWGVLPDELDHPEVWDDWSGGMGYPYRREIENTYNWSEGFDARFPRQLIHAQMPRLFASTAENTRTGARIQMAGGIEASFESSVNYACNRFADSWTSGSPWIGAVALPPNLRSIYMLGKRWYSEVVPTDPSGSFDFYVYRGWVGTAGGIWAGLPTAEYGGRPAVEASYVVLPVLSGTTGLAIDRDGVAQVALGEQATNYVIAGNQLWRSTGPYGGGAAKATALRVCDTRALPITAANWGATLNIGDGEAPILDLVAIEDQVFASTNRGLFAGDVSGTFANVLAELSTQVHPDNGRDLSVYDGGVIYPHISGLWQFKPGDYGGQATHITRSIQPAQTPLAGRFRCTIPYAGWLYAGLYTGTQSYLMAGRPNGDSWAWHSLQRFPHKVNVTRLHVDGAIYASNGVVLPNRLWAATDASIDVSGTAPIYWMPLPPADANPLSEPIGFTPNYIGSARMDLGSVDWGSPGTYKIYRDVEIQADNLASGAQWCRMYYAVDNGPRTSLGLIGKSPKDVLYFPISQDAQTTNLIINPSFESPWDGTGWTEGGTNTRETVTTHARFGTQSERCIYADDATLILRSITLTAATHALSVHIWVPSNYDATALQLTYSGFAGATGDTYADVDMSLRDQWQRVSLTFTPVAGSLTGNIKILLSIDAPTVGRDIFVDGWQCEVGNTPTTYCDGDQPGCYWTGTIGYSSSYRAGGFITGQSIALSLESFTASQAVTPIYRSIVLRGALQPRSVDLITAVARIADNIPDRFGTPMRSGAMMLDDLRALGDPSRQGLQAHTLIDLSGAAQYVKVLGRIQEQEVYQQGDDYPEIAATVRLAVLNFED